MIKIENLTKTFKGQDNVIKALDNVSLSIEDGDIYGIIGMSGAGKSTLVRSINMLERPSKGKVFIDGLDIGELNNSKLLEVRRKVTMIFQHFNLMMQKNVIENIILPLEFAKVNKKESYERARKLLKLVGLSDKEKAYPSQLSGGQKQRVAIARALVTQPKILLCDEATSALDPKTSRSILDLLRKVNAEFNITIIMITHQMQVVEDICRNVAILDHGRVVEEGKVSEIFSNPKSKRAKTLVYPDGFPEYEDSFPDENVLRVVFNGAKATKSPLIASMATRENIEASIISGQTKSINDRMYGNLVLLIPGDRDVLKRAISFFENTKDINVQIVKEKNND